MKRSLSWTLTLFLMVAALCLGGCDLFGTDGGGGEDDGDGGGDQAALVMSLPQETA